MLVIVKEEGRLFRKIEGRTPVELLPRTATELVYAGRELVVRVEHDAETGATKIVYPSLELTAERFEPWEPAAAALASVARRYSRIQVRGR